MTPPPQQLTFGDRHHQTAASPPTEVNTDVMFPLFPQCPASRGAVELAGSPKVNLI